MRNILLALSAASLIVPVGMTAAPTHAEARKKHYQPRVYTRNGKTYCRHSDGTTGLIAGAAGGAIVGSKVIGGGLLGVAAGAVGGAFAGRAIDRTITADNRCR